MVYPSKLLKIYHTRVTTDDISFDISNDIYLLSLINFDINFHINIAIVVLIFDTLIHYIGEIIFI